MRVKNWKKFQHFKDRRPPWIKLYRDILDDPDWHELDAEAAKVLTMIWLVASEDDGALPSVKKLAFRLRMSEAKLNQALSKLSHWLEQDDIGVISPRHQDDAPETETETETETESNDQFSDFWKAYPRKVAKGHARKAWVSACRKAKPAEILAGLKSYRFSDDEKFIPHAATWLNGERWADEKITGPPVNDPAWRGVEI